MTSERRVDGFFYGLFMDVEVLRKHSVIPTEPRRACVEGYELLIGQRSTLAPREGARSYGMVFALSHAELIRLYSAPGLEAYFPEAVLATTLEGEAVPALCYNLLEKPATEERNNEYAERLRTTLNQLGFPADYIGSIP